MHLSITRAGCASCQIFREYTSDRYGKAVPILCNFDLVPFRSRRVLLRAYATTIVLGLLSRSWLQRQTLTALKDGDKLTSAVANRPNDGLLPPGNSSSPSNCIWTLSTCPTPPQRHKSPRPLRLAPLRRAHPLYLRGLLPLELLLRARPVRPLVLPERVSPAQRALSGRPRAGFWCGARRGAAVEAVAGICQGG